jgi:hypothetical protein
MRKIIFFACLCVTLNAHADGSFSVGLDSAFDAVYLRSYFGDFGSKEAAVATSDRVYPYQNSGEFRVFDTTCFDDPVNARVNFRASNEWLGGLLQLRGSADESFSSAWDWNAWINLFNKHLKFSTGNTAQNGSINAYSNFDDFLETRISSMGVLIPLWQKTPMSTSGNLIENTEFPYGYDTPNTTKGYAAFGSSNTLDMFVPAGNAEVDHQTTRQAVGLLTELVFEPVTLSASLAGLFESLRQPFKSAWITTESGGGRLGLYDADYEPYTTTGMNFGVRAEGKKLFDMLNVSAVYKYSANTMTKAFAVPVPTTVDVSGDTNADFTLYSRDPERLIDESIANQTFGLYASMQPLSAFGFTLGYTGLLQSYLNAEPSTMLPDAYVDSKWLSEYDEGIYPFYHSIDLRAAYTGLDKLTVTLNNNVSFASLNGVSASDNSQKIRYANGWAYENQLNETNGENRREDYLGVNTALSLRCHLSENFIAHFEAANQVGVFTLNWEKSGALVSITDSMGLYAGITYILDIGGLKGTVRGGLSLKLCGYSDQEPEHGDVHEAGYLDFGIPLGLRIEY